MMAALPDKAPAKPAQPRKVLVLGKAAGFVHSSIPLAAKTVEALGPRPARGRRRSPTIRRTSTAQNLKQYDAMFLDSTTGAFLDDPNDAAATAARRKALLEFVRGGKGLAGIHAATDSTTQPQLPAGGAPAAAPRRGGPGNDARDRMAAGDRNSDQKLARTSSRRSPTWFDKLDTTRPARSAGRFRRASPPRCRPRPAAAPAPARAAGPGQRRRHVAGVQHDDRRLLQVPLERSAAHHREDRRPEEPADRDVQGQEFEIHDETYTFGMTRSRARTCTSSPASTTRR